MEAPGGNTRVSFSELAMGSSICHHSGTQDVKTDSLLRGELILLGRDGLIIEILRNE